MSIIKVIVIMAETPQLYDPYVPFIVLKTSDYCTREPYNSGSLLGVLRNPESSIVYNSYRINMELPQHYNSWYKNNLHQSVKDLLTLGYKHVSVKLNVS